MRKPEPKELWSKRTVYQGPLDGHEPEKFIVVRAMVFWALVRPLERGPEITFIRLMRPLDDKTDLILT